MTSEGKATSVPGRAGRIARVSAIDARRRARPAAKPRHSTVGVGLRVLSTGPVETRCGRWRPAPIERSGCHAHTALGLTSGPARLLVVFSRATNWTTITGTLAVVVGVPPRRHRCGEPPAALSMATAVVRSLVPRLPPQRRTNGDDRHRFFEAFVSVSPGWCTLVLARPRLLVRRLKVRFRAGSPPCAGPTTCGDRSSWVPVLVPTLWCHPSRRQPSVRPVALTHNRLGADMRGARRARARRRYRYRSRSDVAADLPERRTSATSSYGTSNLASPSTSTTKVRSWTAVRRPRILPPSASRTSNFPPIGGSGKIRSGQVRVGIPAPNGGVPPLARDEELEAILGQP